MEALILVADADPFNLRLLQEVCEAGGHRVISAANGTEVLDAVARERPDLALVDVDLPELDGLEVLRILKADAALASLPVLLVTAPDDLDRRSRGIELGADDYVSKPYRVFEIQQRIRNTLRASGHDLARRDGQVAVEQLGLSLDYEFTRAQRYGHPLACIAVRLAAVGGLSPEAGLEDAMMRLAAGLRTCIRVVDQLFRAGEREYAVLLPETDEAGATVVLNRIRQRVADGTFFGDQQDPAPALRAGLASASDADSGEALYRAAIAALS